MAEKNKEYITSESHVARTEGAGAMEVAYKTKMLRSVLFIDTNNSEYGQGSGCIVGIPRSRPMLLTCNHVIPSKDVASKTTILFDRENSSSPGFPVSGAELFDLDSEDSFVTNAELDYTVIYIKDKQIPGGDRERFFLHKYKKLDDSSLKKLDNVYLLHYPLMDGGFVRRESAYVVKFLSGYLFGHRAETHPGSSGCPVLKEFDNEWVLVGLHRGTMAKRVGSPEINFATHVEAIYKTMTDDTYTPAAPDWDVIRLESAVPESGDEKNGESVLDRSPSDIGLQGVVKEIPFDWRKVAVNLGVSQEKVKACVFDLSGMGEVSALGYWRNGLTGHKTNWRHLLEVVEETCGKEVSSKLKDMVVKKPNWTEEE